MRPCGSGMGASVATTIWPPVPSATEPLPESTSPLASGLRALVGAAGRDRDACGAGPARAAAAASQPTGHVGRLEERRKDAGSRRPGARVSSVDQVRAADIEEGRARGVADVGRDRAHELQPQVVLGQHERWPRHRAARARGGAARRSVGPMNPAAGRVPATARKVSMPISASSSGISSAERWSAQVMARPTGRWAASSSTPPCMWPSQPMPPILGIAGLVQRLAHGHDRVGPPGLGVLLGAARRGHLHGDLAEADAQHLGVLVDDDGLDRRRCRGRCPAVPCAGC